MLDVSDRIHVMCDPNGADAAIIGEINADSKGHVLMKTAIGSTRIVDLLMGEMLARIC
jgi:hydrogenase expression/formation protein HypE